MGTGSIQSVVTTQQFTSVQPVNKNTEENVHTLHRNMLLPLQSIRENETLGQNEALVQADLAMMNYFSC